MKEWKVINLRLPFPPSLNQTYRWGKGNWYKTKTATDYTWMVKRAFLVRRITGFSGGELLKLSVKAFPGDKRRHDIDNILKVLLDSLQAANVVGDDSQIKILHVDIMQHAPKNEDAFVEIELEEIILT